jgi:hypothetical protein
VGPETCLVLQPETTTPNARAFPMRLPRGQRYWTFLDYERHVVADADEFEFMRHPRFARGSAEARRNPMRGGSVP